MKIIHIDVEVRSDGDLKGAGAESYAKHESTTVLCLSYRIDGETETKRWMKGDPVPQDINAEPYIMAAHNAAFERAIFEHNLHPKLGFRLPEYYICTLAAAGLHGLPLGLAKAAEALELPIEKDEEGRKLMMKMCVPPKRKPATLLDYAGVPDEFDDNPDDMKRLGEYCDRDVDVEVGIDERIKLPPFEQQVYNVDQKINSRGVPIDTVTCKAILECISDLVSDWGQELRDLTNNEVSSPTAVEQLRQWLIKHGCLNANDLTKETVQLLLKDPTLSDECRRALEIRQLCSLASTRKYAAMMKCAADDGRARGLFQYAGAPATSRWAGRRIQLQNLPRLSLSDDEVKLAVECFRDKDLDTMKLFLGAPMDIAKQLLRPMVQSDRGLVVGDWNAIELRVSAWLSGEEYLLKLLANGEDVYKDMASRIYGVPVDQVTKDQRQIGKIVVLGCGYSLGAGREDTQQGGLQDTLRRFGVDADYNLAKKSVTAYRKANPNIVKLWWAINDAMFHTFDTGETTQAGKYLTFSPIDMGRGKLDNSIAMQLPSGRKIIYHALKEYEGDFGRELTCAAYDGVAGRKRKKIYGGLITENACQGTARDILAHTLVRLDEESYETIGHVHDEVLVEGTHDVDSIKRIMETLPPWAKGLPLKAEVFSCSTADHRYTK